MVLLPFRALPLLLGQQVWLAIKSRARGRR